MEQYTSQFIRKTSEKVLLPYHTAQVGRYWYEIPSMPVARVDPRVVRHGSSVMSSSVFVLRLLTFQMWTRMGF